MASEKKTTTPRTGKPRNADLEIGMHDHWELVRVWVRHAGRYPCKPSWRIDRFLSNHYCFFYIEKGEGTVIRNEEALEAKAGDLILIQPGHHYESFHDPKNPVTVLSIGFTLKGAGNLDLMLRYALPDRIRLSLKEISPLTTLYESVMIHFYRKSSLSNLAMRGALLTLVASVLRLNEDVPNSRKTGVVTRPRHLDERAELARRFIDKNLNKSLSLQIIAKAAHLSPVYFANLFRRELGQSPMAYVRHRRIEVARAFLSSPTPSISEVARKVGFDDPFHFSRVFHRLEGCSPTEFRESCKDPFNRREIR